VMRLVDSGHLPHPDYVIGGVGTQMTNGFGHTVFDWEQQLKDGWDWETVANIVSKHCDDPQPVYYQNRFKCSWYWPDATAEDLRTLSSDLDLAEIRHQVVYSSRRDLDIIPLRAGKGHALAWLADHLAVDVKAIVVAGDSANDASAFALPLVRGIVVANAHDDLKAAVDPWRTHQAVAPGADGVAEGLRWWNDRIDVAAD